MKFNLILLSALTLMTACGVSNDTNSKEYHYPQLEEMSDRIEYARQMALRYRGVGSVYNWRSPVEGFNGTIEITDEKNGCKHFKETVRRFEQIMRTETYQYCQENGGWMNYY